MYQYDESNFINEMIGLAYVEIFITIMCCFLMYYLCRVKRNRLGVVVFFTIIKIYIWNIVSQIIIFYSKGNVDKVRLWVAMANIILGMTLIAIYKVCSEAKISELFAATMLEDAICLPFFVLPYLGLKKIMMNGSIYFYNSPNPIKSVLFIVIITTYYVLLLFLLRKFFKFFSKYFKFKRKITTVIVFTLYTLILISTFVSYYNSEAYVKGNLIVLFVIIMIIGFTIPYIASVYVRKRDAKQEMEQHSRLVEEKEQISEANKDSNEMTEEDRKFRHDIDKHMNVIKEMVDEGASEEEVKEYAASIKETYK